MIESKVFNRSATIILTLLVIIAMLPIALIVIASFTDESALIANGYSFTPTKWSFDAYYYMIKQGTIILRCYVVSFLVTVFGTSLGVLLPTMWA